MIEVKLERFDKIREETVAKGISNGLAEASAYIQREARNNHRYRSRTGNLRGATVARSYKDYINAEILDGAARYGRYVHGGHGSWAPDPFVEDAIKNNLNVIDELIAKGIDKKLRI